MIEKHIDMPRTKSTKRKPNKTKKREYKTHKWVISNLTSIRNFAEYKANKHKQEYDKLTEDYRYATAEYIRGIMPEEEYKKLKAEYKRYSSRVKQWYTVQTERVEYIDELIETEKDLMEEAARKI